MRIYYSLDSFVNTRALAGVRTSWESFFDAHWLLLVVGSTPVKGFPGWPDTFVCVCLEWTTRVQCVCACACACVCALLTCAQDRAWGADTQHNTQCLRIKGLAHTPSCRCRRHACLSGLLSCTRWSSCHPPSRAVLYTASRTPVFAWCVCIVCVACVCVCVYVRVTCACLCTCVCMYVCTCVFVCLVVFVYVHVYVCVCVCVWTIDNLDLISAVLHQS